MGKAKVKSAFQLAGTQHKYQKILVLLISLSWTVLNFVLLGSTLIYMDPVFHCNNDYDTKVFQKQACPQIKNCQLIQKFTLTAELGLYCSNQWARDLIQSIFAIGCIIGLFAMNLVSDTKSRKLAVVLCLLIVTVGISITIFGGWLNSIPIVIVSQFIQGFGTSSMLSLSYAFLSDFCSDRIKPRSVIIVNTAWSLSTVLLGLFYLIQIKWWIFLTFVVLIPLIIVGILFQIYLLQSPYILMLRNKKQETLQVLIKVAKINGFQHHIKQIQEIINHQHEKDAQSKASIKNVFKILKQSQYLRPLIVVCILRTVGCLNFFGTSYAFDVEGLGLGYNSMIAGFMEIISFFGLTIFINKIPRRKGIAGFYIIVIGLGMLFFFDFVKNNSIVVTIVMGVSRIFSTISYTLIASVQTQAFTNQIQSTAVGITQAFGLLGAMCGPLIVDLGDKIGIDPIVLIASLLIFAIWPNIFLKQTLNAHLNKQKQSLLANPQQDPTLKDSLLSQSTIITSDITNELN